MRALILLAFAAAAAGPWDSMPEDRLSLHHRAVAHWGLGMYETAAREFDELLAARPAPPPAIVNMGMMRLFQRKYEAALPHLELAARLDPADARVRYLLGKCLLGLERPADAAAQLSEAARLDPREPAIALRLSEAHAMRGDSKSARAELRRALALRPDHAAALYRLGRMLEREGEGAEGARLLERFGRLGKKKARESELTPYESPLEPPPAPAAGGGRLEVKPVGLEAGAPCAVVVQAGRLVLRRASRGEAVRFDLGARAEADVVRVDWADGTHTHRVGAPARGKLVIEQVSAHVW